MGVKCAYAWKRLLLRDLGRRARNTIVVVAVRAVLGTLKASHSVMLQGGPQAMVKLFTVAPRTARAWEQGSCASNQTAR